jgi:hypothetical protein
LNSKCDLDLGGRWPVLRMTHCLIIVNNCCKYLQNPFKDKEVMDRTRHIPSNRQCWPWMSKCDLESGGRGLVVVHDTSCHYSKYLCQVISDSFDKWQSNGPDTKVWRTDRQMFGRTGPISISPFFLRKGGGQLRTYSEYYINLSLINKINILGLALTYNTQEWIIIEMKQIN